MTGIGVGVSPCFIPALSTSSGSDPVFDSVSGLLSAQKILESYESARSIDYSPATPPTVTLGSTDPSTINSRTLIQGGIVPTASVPDGYSHKMNTGAAWIITRPPATQTPTTMTYAPGNSKLFVFEGQAFDFKVAVSVGKSFSIRWSEDNGVTWYQSGPYVNTLTSWALVDFGSVDTRVVEVICEDQSFQTYGFNFDTGATPPAAFVPDIPFGAMFGDSYVFGQGTRDDDLANNQQATLGMTRKFAEKLKAFQIMPHGLRANGFSNNGGGLHSKYHERINLQTAYSSISEGLSMGEHQDDGYLDYVVIPGTINDASHTYDSVRRTDVARALRYLRVKQPKALILMPFGANPPDQGEPTEWYEDCLNGFKDVFGATEAEWIANGAYFLDGSRAAGAEWVPEGEVGSSLYFADADGDEYHPNVAGHDYFAGLYLAGMVYLAEQVYELYRDHILDLSPLVWLDGEDAETLSGAEWVDKSGNDYGPTQATEAKQPTVTEGGLMFDGSNDYLSFSSDVYSALAEGNNTVFVVAQNLTALRASQFKRILSGKVSSTTNFGILMATSAGGDFSIQNRFGSTIVTNSTDDLAVKIYGHRSIGNDFSPVYGEVQPAQYGSAPITLTELTLGGDTFTSAQYANILVKEVLIFDRALSDEEMEYVGNRLADRHSTSWSNIPSPNAVNSLFTEWQSINAYGDSITAGAGADPTTNGWAFLLENTLHGKVRNAAIGGTVLQNSNGSGGVPLTNNGRDRYGSGALTGSNKKTMFFSLYGYNDLRYTGNPTEFNVTAFKNDYQEIITGLLADGYAAENIILGSPMWNTDYLYSVGSTGFTGSDRETHEAYVTAVFELAQTNRCYYAPVYETTRDEGGESIIGDDYLHPNNDGHQLILEAFMASYIPDEAVILPSDIDSALRWFDYETEVTTVSGDVSAWGDQLDIANAGQSNASYRPTLAADELYFNGTQDDRLTMTDTGITDDLTFIAVIRVDALGGSHGIMAGTTTGGPVVRIGNTGLPAIIKQGVITRLAGTNAISADTDYIISGTLGSSGHSLFTNGVPNGSNATAGGYTAGFTVIGAESGGYGNCMTGGIKAIEIYDGLLSTENHNARGQALADKYELTWTDIE